MNVPVLVACFVAGFVLGGVIWRRVAWRGGAEDTIRRRFGVLSLERQRALIAQLQMELQMREERVRMVTSREG